MSTPPLIRNETPQDAAAAEALVDRAFGPGRYAKSAERLREGNRHLPELSFVAEENGRLVGSVRLWPVSVGGREAVFLGPIAVDPSWRSRGLGQALVERACAAADCPVLLVGDAPWFERMGFAVAPGVLMPGPVDPRRVLARGGEGLEGPVRGR